MMLHLHSIPIASDFQSLGWGVVRHRDLIP